MTEKKITILPNPPNSKFERIAVVKGYSIKEMCKPKENGITVFDRDIEALAKKEEG